MIHTVLSISYDADVLLKQLKQLVVPGEIWASSDDTDSKTMIEAEQAVKAANQAALATLPTLAMGALNTLHTDDEGEAAGGTNNTVDLQGAHPEDAHPNASARSTDDNSTEKILSAQDFMALGKQVYM